MFDAFRGTYGRYKSNMWLNRFVRQYATPVVLLMGLLLVFAIHFRGTLAVTKAQDDLFRGSRAYSVGAMQYTFQQESGGERPVIAYRGLSLLTYVEWNSMISVDGHLTNLWDSGHGYDYNDAKQQMFSTASGPGWQVTQIVTLVDERHVQVDYYLTARRQGVAEPHQVTLIIEHDHAAWYQPTVTNNTFAAGVLPGAFTSSITSKNPPKPSANVQFRVAGPAVAPNAIALLDLRGELGADGVQRSVVTAFTTTYSISNPLVDKLTPLGTETLTYSSGA